MLVLGFLWVSSLEKHDYILLKKKIDLRVAQIS